MNGASDRDDPGCGCSGCSCRPFPVAASAAASPDSPAVQDGIVDQDVSSSGDGRTGAREGAGGLSAADREAIFLGGAFLLFALGIVFQPLLASTPGRIGEYLVFAGLWAAAGRDVLARTARGILRGKFLDEHFLMTVATLGAMAVDALPEAAGVMIFYGIGEHLQERAVGRSRRRIGALLDIRPRRATVVDEQGTRTVDPAGVLPGSIIVVRPGERIPLDGILVSGSSLVDSSAITGESLPLDPAAGEELAAGSICLTGILRLRTIRPYAESSVARILELVEHASARKTKTEKFFSVFARRYTPVVVVVALATAFGPPLLVPGQNLADWVYRALVMLVISCPCALVISIPLTYFGGIGAASARGVLVKGSDFLDSLAKTDTVVFDKTGTLTSGGFEVVSVEPAEGFDDATLAGLAAAAESHSNHPLAVSIRRYFEGSGAAVVHEPEAYEESGGLGVRATIGGRRVIAGNERLLRERGVVIPGSEGGESGTDGGEGHGRDGTIVHVAVDGSYAGRIRLEDRLKPDSARAVRELRDAGVRRIVMLTGDGPAAAARVAAALGVDEWHARLLPSDKVDRLETIMADPDMGPGKTVVFVGDGINDAPVLARADVGISMGGAGSDAAVETSDVVIIHDSPAKIPEAILLARRTRRILVQNIVLALGVKLAFIALGAAGVATMWEAVFGDAGVAVLAVLNATRASKVPGRPGGDPKGESPRTSPFRRNPPYTAS